MKTAGLVLDFYDDKKGEVLKSKCPTVDDLPEVVKEAHILTPEERDVLRDEAYALIMKNGDSYLRKFACVDEGNTVLSTIYLLENHDKLPPEAVKVAAQNLVAFNEEFGLPVPDMLKVAAATGMSRTRAVKIADAKKNQMDGRWNNDTNTLPVQGSDDGKVMSTTENLKTASSMPNLEGLARTIGAHAAVGATGGAALGAVKPGKDKDGKKRGRLSGAARGGVKGGLVGGGVSAGVFAGTQAGREWIGDAAREVARKAQSFKKVANVVDVTNLRPPKQIEKKASRTALDGHYSLDSYTDVREAIEFFSWNGQNLSPRERHEFAVKTAARADELGIQVTEVIARYGSTEYAPDVDAHLASRKMAAPDMKEVWDDLAEKRAMVDPENFAQLLAEADEIAGLHYEYGGSVFDPYFATFGGGGVEKVAWAHENSDGEQITEDDLRNIPVEKIRENFSPDFADAFEANPTVIFDSMPADTKSVIARMAKEE